MANYIYNPYRGEERQKKLYDFEQSKSLNENLEKTFEKIGRNISDSISESTREIVGSLDESFNVVTNVLGTGFSGISSNLDNINSSIENLTFSTENLALMLDWRLSEEINQQRISNLLLGNVALLLRVPDFQKERQYYIEQGFKHYKNASLDADLYEDALKNLLEAEKRETTDYIVLYQIGMIYLHSTKKESQDWAKAEDYFRRAAKYSIVESNPESQRTLNILVGEVNQNISTPEAAKEFAARAYFRAGIACYRQDKFAEAAELCEKAYSLSPSLLEAGFLQAKSLAVLDKAEESVEILRGVIQAQPFIYALKTASDTDLEPKGEVQQLLIQLRDSAVYRASERLSKLKAENINEPQFTSILSRVELLIRKNTFLDALNALDELTKEREWQIESFGEVLYERSLQNNSNLEETDRKIFFNNLQKYKRRHFHNIEDFVLELRKIGSWLRKGIERKKLVEAEMQRRAEDDKQLLLRLEQHRKQIREFISQAKEVEGRNRNLAISLYEEAAKLGSYEARQILQDLKKGYQKQTSEKIPHEQIKELLLKAQTEEEAQNRKWLFKNYDLAIYFYEEAAKLGSSEARQRLRDLKSRIGLT